MLPLSTTTIILSFTLNPFSFVINLNLIAFRSQTRVLCVNNTLCFLLSLSGDAVYVWKKNTFFVRNNRLCGKVSLCAKINTKIWSCLKEVFLCVYAETFSVRRHLFCVQCSLFAFLTPMFNCVTLLPYEAPWRLWWKHVVKQDALVFEHIFSIYFISIELSFFVVVSP